MAVKNIDPYDYEEMKYEPNYLGIKKLGPVMIICGQSNSGKSVILNNIFRRKLIYEYECKNVYFFSKTIRGDLTYKPTLKLLSTRTDPPSKINIFKTVDFEMINKIVEKLENIGVSQMYAKTKADEPELPKILFVFDDMLSDVVFKSHQSELSGFACLCRHYGISMIILSQKWTSIPDTIRLLSNISILCSTDNYKKSMIEENALHGQERLLDRAYQEMNGHKDYSFMVINKSLPFSDRTKIFHPDGTIEHF